MRLEILHRAELRIAKIVLHWTFAAKVYEGANSLSFRKHLAHKYDVNLIYYIRLTLLYAHQNGIKLYKSLKLELN